jgi:hypothetical protein
MNKLIAFWVLAFISNILIAQKINTDSVVQKYNKYIYYNRLNPTGESKLKGSLNKYNEWFDVTHYRLELAPAMSERKLSGSVTMSYNVKDNSRMDTLLLNLHRNFRIERVTDANSQQLAYRRIGP